MPTSETPSQARIRLTETRVSSYLSQQEVADKIGTTYVNVSRWERGITRPNPYFRRKLCALFQKTEEELDLLPTKPGRGSSSKTSAAAVTTASSAPAPVAVPRTIYDAAIPLQAIQLIGRDQNIAQITQCLTGEPSGSVTALNGLPGVGKTALSVAIAYDTTIRTFFSDGILWASLGPQPNIPGIFSRWGSLLGMSFAQMTSLATNEAKAKAIRSAIGHRKMLIVIDDAWKLEEALAFQVGGGHCAHLVTTRFPFIASHMALNNAIKIEALTEDQSIDLLNTLAPQVINRERQKVHALVQAVGGLPLALTLMGNYLRKQAYGGPARRITSALERLSKAEVRLKLKEPHNPSESHPSLPMEQSLSIQSIIAVTDQLLDQKTRQTLYALSVFPPKPNTFSEESAMAVADCSYEQLDALSDTGLLESNGERYVLHQVISDYALLQIEEDQLQQSQERLITYYAIYVEEHQKDYEQLEIESDTIFAALESAHEQNKAEELIHITCSFAPFLIMRGLYQQALQYLEKAYEVAQQQKNNYGITGTLLYLGQISQKQGNFAQAEQYFQQGLDLARAENEQERICELLTGLGSVKWRMGKHDQAKESLEDGLILARQINDKESIVGLLRILGSVVGSHEDHVQASSYFQEGLTLAEQLNNREQICVLLSNLGKAAMEMGNMSQAKGYYQKGLVIARQIGDREQICVLLTNLGDVLSEQGDLIQAEIYLQEGLILAREINHREWLSALLINLGVTERKKGEYKKAKHHIQESLNLAKQIGHPYFTGMILWEYGSLYLDQEKIEEAKNTFNEMLQIINPEYQDLFALANYNIARIAAIQGDMSLAQKLGEENVKALEMMHHRKAEEARRWLNSIM
ncbi:tetratricopeptide repeat protein [Dictyobacter arantiisoli]|uniref:HTH cro/C1-type domain-containing protein n=1 Tax=Dictyobacter arantiisoli TaxID=2014874 RepID=A0A5A5TJ73_9CHLR|nr:tetratricopeptide repeat protein [Dictyobacter arantiisoli]GCF11275.1 hypothetical protein KDI_48390 [Dictyobacter arantiisoli]